MPKSSLTKDDENRAEALLRSGMWPAEVGEEVGASRAAIHRLITKRGIPRDAYRYKWLEDKGMKSLRRQVADMKPMEAVAFLLDEIEAACAAQDEDATDVIKAALPNLTRSEAALLAVLADRRQAKFVKKEYILTCMYGHTADEPDIKIVDVFVCKMRKKLVDTSIKIATVWGCGYRLISESPLPWETA